MNCPYCLNKLDLLSRYTNQDERWICNTCLGSPYFEIKNNMLAVIIYYLPDKGNNFYCVYHYPINKSTEIRHCIMVGGKINGNILSKNLCKLNDVEINPTNILGVLDKLSHLKAFI